MKDLNTLDKYRKDCRSYFGSLGDHTCGAFKVYVGGRSFYVVASANGGWDHVSVTLCHQKRCPTWEEMCAIKDLFFEAEEAVVQVHPRKSEYVNRHPYCLHLWRPLGVELPMPPKWFV